jgi:ATP-dependent DNA helicase DinG
MPSTQRGVLLAEAGTGTGKTFAYLVPALLSG